MLVADVDHGSTLTGLQQLLGSTRTAGGLDVALTKIAVDFQNLDGANAAALIGASVEEIRAGTSCDAVCVALLDPSGRRIQRVFAARDTFTAINPEVMQGEALEAWPWLDKSLVHLRLLGIADTTQPQAAQRMDADRLRTLGGAAALLVGFDVTGQRAGFMAFFYGQPQQAWNADHQLLIKLLTSSLAAGLERSQARQALAEIAERDAAMIATANDGTWDFDPRDGIMRFTPRWLAIMGYTEEDVQREPIDWRRLVHTEELPRVQGKLREHIAGHTPVFDSIHRMQRKDGEWRWMHSRAKALLDADGRLRRLIGVETDITEQKIYEEALFREKESAQITLQSIGDGVVTTDAACHVEYLNPIAEELTGWKLDEAAGRHIDDVFRGFHEETCEPLENPLSVAIRRTRPVKSVRPTLLIRRDGNEIYIESTAAPIRNDRGEVTGAVLVFHDVSESRELNRRLSYHASHDILTGLVNRREFETRLERALKSAKAREASYALCYLDLDQFKMVNDSCGHAAGDALLGQLGALLKSKIRWRDTLARLGGDEFGLLLESCNLEEAVRAAEGLKTAIQEHKFDWDDRSFRLGVSIGVVPITPETTDVTALLAAGDSACQAAKGAGRNRIYSYQENDLDLMRRRREMQWAARIASALEESRFELFRMPIQPLQVEEFGAHYEILLRMRDEQGALVSPDLFIAAAERYGITPRIDRWVVETAFRWLVSEADERERLALCSINLSGLSLVDDDFLPFVVRQFQKSGLDATKICFEITETSAIASYAQASRFINSLKELGCKFALDDFGTGLSSFGYLKHFPVDYLKIDGSFVKEILHDPIDREMVRSINEIGHLTGKKTIAEYAANTEIITMLKGMGIDYAQGYGISEPKRILMTAVAVNG
ncbi:MAG: EAL domain-containing protein [Gammaproteobacteria bacterium]|nr:EAL domain-containing protein [Gammaproteobacteria bacterium]